MKRAKAGRQPPPALAELPKRCLQRGSDATRRHRPTKRSRFSPGKHIGVERKGVKNDAFNKGNSARGRRRHWSASKPRLSPPPDPSPKLKAEERHSAEEPAGGPAADPKTRTSRTAACRGMSGGGATTATRAATGAANYSPRASDDDDAATGGATRAPGRATAVATRPQASPDQSQAPGLVAVLAGGGGGAPRPAPH